MKVLLTRTVMALALMGGAALAPSVLAADIAGRMTADYLLQCQANQNACRDFTNNVLQVLTSAAYLGQKQLYKGCAPVPIDPAETGKLLEWILSHPQRSTGYAADDIAMAAEALWPCK
jgi:hypothetical protein